MALPVCKNKFKNSKKKHFLIRRHKDEKLHCSLKIFAQQLLPLPFLFNAIHNSITSMIDCVSLDFLLKFRNDCCNTQLNNNSINNYHVNVVNDAILSSFFSSNYRNSILLVVKHYV